MAQKKQRASLLENADNGFNPFDLLQTVSTPKENTVSNDDIFSANDSEENKPIPRTSASHNGIKEPIQTKKKKSKSNKRSSEPATAPQQTGDTNSKPNGNDDDNLLDFFASMGPEVTQPEKDEDDPFGFFKGMFDNNKKSSTTTDNTNSNNNNNDNNNKPIVKNTNSNPPINNTNSKDGNRASVNSTTTQELFDPNMWEDFGNTTKSDNNSLDISNSRTNKAKSTPNVQPIRNNKNNQTLDVVQEKTGNKDEEKDDDDDTSEASDSDSGNNNTKDIKDIKDTKDNKNNNKDNDVSDPSKRRASAPIKNPATSTNALEELHRGTALLKYPRRHGFPHFKHVQLSKDNKRIQWFSKRKSLNETCIWIKDIKEVVKGQETETFKKYQQQALEKASFSVVHSNTYKTLDLVAKSTDECDMWVKSLQQLLQMVREGKDVGKLTELDVGIKFRDRNRPRSRRGSGHFVRANNSKAVKIDPMALKQIEKDMETLHKNFQRTAQLSQKSAITKSDEFHNIQQVLAELEERIEELTHEVTNTRDTEMSKRDVWRATVDLTAMTEKVEVLLKSYGDTGSNRNSSIF